MAAKKWQTPKESSCPAQAALDPALPVLSAPALEEEDRQRLAELLLSPALCRRVAARAGGDARALQLALLDELGRLAGDGATDGAGATARSAELPLEEAAAALLRGQLASGRLRLRELQPLTVETPALEAQRLTTLAWSFLLEGRPLRALVLARRARLVQRPHAGALPPPMAAVTEVLALLGLGELERAELLVEREPAPAEPEAARTAQLLRAAIAFARGELHEGLRLAALTPTELGTRADALSSALLGAWFARAAIGLGQLDEADRFVRVLQSLAADPALGALQPLAQREAALLAEARGDREEAQRLAQAAGVARPASFEYRLDAWALCGNLSQPAPPAAGALAAWAELRAAERALSVSDFAESERAATRAAVLYRARGLRYEQSRALAVQAEAAACLGHAEDALQAVGGFEAVAERQHYRLLKTRAALVRASLADRAGNLERYAQQLSYARDAAELPSGALGRALVRLGLPAPREAQAGTGDPFRETILRLALDRPRDYLCARPGRLELLAASEPVEAAMIAHPDRGAIECRGQRIPVFPQLLRLLELLVDAGPRGVTAEEIYLCLWSSREYHRLRHRNNVYVAVARLRQLAEPLLDGAPFIERLDDRYRLVPDRSVAILRRLDPGPPLLDGPPDPNPPLAIARWHRALLEAR